jgi:hypothetical protein
MTNPVAAIVLSLAAVNATVDKVLDGPRFLTGKEMDRLVAILHERPESSWKTVDDVKTQRERMKKLQDAVDSMRSDRREPLKFVSSWWKVLSRRRIYPSQNRLRGKLTSRPFSGYHLSVPSTYDPARPARLVICLHPSGDFDGRKYIQTYWSTKALRDSAILFAPDWPPEEGPPRWSDRRLLDLTFEVLGGIIFNEFNIDRNRIFLDGAGDSGTEAWKLAGVYHVFAGLIIRAGRPPGYDLSDSKTQPGERPAPTHSYIFRDLENTAVLFFDAKRLWNVKSRRDLLPAILRENTRFTRFVELPEDTDPRRIETAADPMQEPVLAFVTRTRRNPYPRTVEWTVKDTHTRRAYWIRSLDEEPSFDDRTLPNFSVSLDRRNNLIEIRSHRIRGFEISLNDMLLDLDRTVTIRANGQIVFHGQPVRSLARMFRGVARSGDWTDVYPWVTQIEVPPERPGR